MGCQRNIEYGGSLKQFSSGPKQSGGRFRSKVQKEDELVDKKTWASSRSIKKPTWMSEYV